MKKFFKKLFFKEKYILDELNEMIAKVDKALAIQDETIKTLDNILNIIEK